MLKTSGKYVIGWNGGITGPNASLICVMPDRELNSFLLIARAYADGDASQLVALIPNLEGNGQKLAEKIVDLLNKESQ